MFKPGDKVVVIDGPQKGEKVRTLKNRVDSVFFTNFPVRVKNQHYDAKGNWYAGAKVCLRHATPEEIAAAEKPLHRGDLVEFRGSIWVVIDSYSDGNCWIGSITGHAKTRCHAANEMTRVGSIRKKAKRLEQESEMSRFKVGDLVTPISVKPYSDRIQRRLLGKTLVIYSFQDNGNSFLVFAGVIGDCGFFWHPDDLRLVSETQAEPAPEPAPDVPAPERAAPEPAPEAQMPERSKLRTVNWGGCGYLNPYADTSPTNPTDPAPAQKPLRRGDLVEYDGRVCVVFSDRDLVGHFFVSALSGVSDYYHCNEEELTRIGSIRKKIKRIKKEMEGGK